MRFRRHMPPLSTWGIAWKARPPELNRRQAMRWGAYCLAAALAGYLLAALLLFPAPVFRSRHPVPRVLGYAQVDNKEKGREAWLVMSRLEGRPLWNEILHASSRRRARLLRHVGELLKRLHATAVPIDLRSESPWVDQMLAEARKNLRWCDGTVELLASLLICMRGTLHRKLLDARRKRNRPHNFCSAPADGLNDFRH